MELAKIDQHDIAQLDQPLNSMRPDIAGAIDFVHPVTPVRVRREVEVRERLVERRFIGDEALLELARQERRKLVRLETGLGEIRSSDHANRPDESPRSSEAVQKAFAAAGLPKYAQQQESQGRPVCGG